VAEQRKGLHIVPISILSILLAIAFLRLLNMNTPGFWIASWRSDLVDKPSIGTGFLVMFAVDSVLWFAAIFRIRSLWLLRSEMQEEMQRHGPGFSVLNNRVVTATVLCAVPLSAYAVTASVGFLDWQRLSRSHLGLAAYFILVSAVFFALIVSFYVGSLRRKQRSSP